MTRRPVLALAALVAVSGAMVGAYLASSRGSGDHALRRLAQEGATPARTATSRPEPALPTASSETPTPAPVTDWDQLISDVADHLTSHSGSPDCLADLSRQWNMPSGGTPQCVAADLNGDGRDDYVVRLTRYPRAREPSGYVRDWLFGRIVIFVASDESYRLALNMKDMGSSLYEERVLQNPVIFAVQDINADGMPEILLTTSSCGAHTCFLSLYVLGYRDGRYVNLIEPTTPPTEYVSQPITSNQLRISDVDNDGISEIIFRQGLITSAGAGPQREGTRTYRWNGDKYAPASFVYDPSDLSGAQVRYFWIRDADAAFTNGQYEDAITLYNEAITRTDMKDVDYWGDPAELIAYARFRIGLSRAALGDGAGALAALDDALTANPQALHSQLAGRFRESYAVSNDVASGCSAALSFIDENADAFSRLWNYGYANPNPGIEKSPLCPL